MRDRCWVRRCPVEYSSVILPLHEGCGECGAVRDQPCMEAPPEHYHRARFIAAQEHHRVHQPVSPKNQFPMEPFILQSYNRSHRR